MITTGLIMTITGVVGVIATIITFTLTNKSISKKLELLTVNSISNGQVASNINARIKQYATDVDTINSEVTNLEICDLTQLLEESNQDETMIIEDLKETEIISEMTEIL